MFISWVYGYFFFLKTRLVFYSYVSYKWKTGFAAEVQEEVNYSSLKINLKDREANMLPQPRVSLVW